MSEVVPGRRYRVKSRSFSKTLTKGPRKSVRLTGSTRSKEATKQKKEKKRKERKSRGVLETGTDVLDVIGDSPMAVKQHHY
jgi:hypothetical protein